MWLDVEDIPAGMNWSSAIQEGLRQCDLMIVIISPDSMASRNVEEEWQYYRDRDKPIVPVLWRRADVHYQLSRLQYIDFEQQAFDKAFKQLHSELRRKGMSLKLLGSGTDSSAQIPRQAPLPVRGRRQMPRWLIGAGLLALVGVIGAGLIVANGGLPSPQTPLPPAATRLGEGLSETEATAGGGAPETPAGIAQNATAAQGAEATIDIDGTIGALQTLSAGQTMTARPTSTPTPSPTPMPTVDTQATIDAALTATQSAIGDANAPPLGFSSNLVRANAQWMPYIEQYARTFEGIEMVLVPAGCFRMGGDPDAYQGGDDGGEQCFDAPFWIGRYEITNAQYGSAGYFTGDQRPRENITWLAARDFCASKGLRLPTEAEWEYAARGPDGNLFPWGNTFDGTLVVWNRSSADGTAPVGSFPGGASWVGMLDMSGNVWEWTSTVFRDYPYRQDDGREQDSDDPNTLRVLRGGSWDGLNSDDLRAAARIGDFADFGNYDGGFRCARSY